MLRETSLVDLGGRTIRNQPVTPGRSNDTPDRSTDRSDSAGLGRGRLARTGLLAVGLLAVTGTASAQHGGGMMGGGGAGTFGVPGLGLVFWILLAVGVVLLVGYARDSPESSTEPRRDQALDTLKERYARGELSTEEFESRRAELERSR